MEEGLGGKGRRREERSTTQKGVKRGKEIRY
jgi:hypothetical protein